MLYGVICCNTTTTELSSLFKHFHSLFLFMVLFLLLETKLALDKKIIVIVQTFK